MKKSLCLLSFLFLTGCNEYWWTRGQPPSVKDLIDRANLRFSESTTNSSRSDFLPSAQKLKSTLLNSLEALYKNEADIEALKEAEQSFIDLEGKMSIGSRAAYGELCNQMRAFMGQLESSKKLDKSAYGLFVSRTIFFLANELKVPAPTF